SNQVANYFRRAGVKRGDHVMVMLNNQVELWETMLAGVKLGAALMPATTQLGPIDLSDRVERGRAEFVVAGPDDAAKFAAVAAASPPPPARGVARPPADEGLGCGALPRRAPGQCPSPLLGHRRAPAHLPAVAVRRRRLQLFAVGPRFARFHRYSGWVRSEA